VSLHPSAHHAEKPRTAGPTSFLAHQPSIPSHGHRLNLNLLQFNQSGLAAQSTRSVIRHRNHRFGGLGFASAANIGDTYAVFEPTHGSAPKYDGKFVVNPMAMLLTVKLMFDWLKEDAAAAKLEKAIATVIKEGKVATYDVKGRDPRKQPELDAGSGRRGGAEVLGPRHSRMHRRQYFLWIPAFAGMTRTSVIPGPRSVIPAEAGIQFREGVSRTRSGSLLSQG